MPAHNKSCRRLGLAPVAGWPSVDFDLKSISGTLGGNDAGGFLQDLHARQPDDLREVHS